MSTARVSFFNRSVPWGLSTYRENFQGGKLNVNQDLGVKVATPVGTLVGQLFFGWLADVVGRKKMCECFHGQSRSQPISFNDDPS